MIHYQGVTRHYGKKVAVKCLNLHIKRGELFCLLGHNGAGKTTSIKMLVGLLKPQAGTVKIADFDVTTHTREAAQLIGYVPDQPFLYEKLSGREFLHFVGEMHGLSGKTLLEQVDQEIERFGLNDFVDGLTESYSHGMKQRTVFASALLHSPEILVIDEPMVGLDPHSIRLVKDLLRAEVANGLSVLMSTHTLTAAEEISDRIGVMNQGELVFEGPASELPDSAQGDRTLESRYLAMIESHQNPASVKASESEDDEKSPSEKVTASAEADTALPKGSEN